MELPDAARALKRSWDRLFEVVSKPAGCMRCEAGAPAWNGSCERSITTLSEEGEPS